MRLPLTVFALCIASGTAQAQSIIDRSCGPNHVNQIAEIGDITENPDGYYVRSLQVQLSHGDPRIVQSVGKTFHLCTSSAATPDMDSTKALLMMSKQRVKFLFVPADCPRQHPTS